MRPQQGCLRQKKYAGILQILETLAESHKTKKALLLWAETWFHFLKPETSEVQSLALWPQLQGVMFVHITPGCNVATPRWSEDFEQWAQQF